MRAPNALLSLVQRIWFAHARMVIAFYAHICPTSIHRAVARKCACTSARLRLHMCVRARQFAPAAENTLHEICRMNANRSVAHNLVNIVHRQLWTHEVRSNLQQAFFLLITVDFSTCEFHTIQCGGLVLQNSNVFGFEGLEICKIVVVPTIFFIINCRNSTLIGLLRGMFDVNFENLRGPARHFFRFSFAILCSFMFNLTVL